MSNCCLKRFPSCHHCTMQLDNEKVKKANNGRTLNTSICETLRSKTFVLVSMYITREIFCLDMKYFKDYLLHIN